MTYEQLLNDLLAIKDDNPEALKQPVRCVLGDEAHHLDLFTNLTQDTIYLLPIFGTDADPVTEETE